MDLKALAKLYDSRVRSYGVNPASVGWRDVDQQIFRFDLLLIDAGLTSSSRILDVGTGFGSLLDRIKVLFPGFSDCNFEGWDIAQEMINQAKKLHPEATFSQFNVFEYSPSDREWEWIFLSGTLNIKLDEWDKYSELEKLIQNLFLSATKGIRFNLISDQVDYQDEFLQYYSMSHVVNIMQKFTRKFWVKSNYPLWEFTCSMEK